MVRSVDAALSAGGLSYENLVTVLVDSTIGIYVDHPVEGCTYGNDALCRMAGRPWEEIRGFGWANCVHPEDIELLRAAVERFEHERGIMQVQYRTLHPDGTVRVLLSRAQAVLDTEGTHVGTVAIVRDVTEQNAAAYKAEQSSKLETIGRLASRVAHDFNNSLAAILGSVCLLETQDLDEEGHEYVTLIQQAVEHASITTSQLLGLTRQKVGQSTAARLDHELDAFTPFLRTVLGEGVSLTVELGAPERSVALAAHQLGQIVVNLCVNARDAGATNIELTTGVEGSTIELRVSDDGSGVPESIQQRVFEPFFTTKPIGEGTGLGLPTVRDLVLRAGGAITIDSQPDEGSVFRVTMPEAATPVQAALNVPTRDLPGGARVLLVDDNDALRQSLAIALGLAGHHVVTAADLNGARAQLESAEFDVVVTDVALPDGSGEELAPLPNTGFVYMSGFAGERLAQEALEEPRARFLQKPFNPRLLMVAVDEVRSPSGS